MKKKICRRCGSTLKSKYSFCPYCGNVLDKKEENFGMLGRDDSPNENMFGSLMQPGGFNMFFSSILRNLEKQLNLRGEKNQNLQGEKNSKDTMPEMKKNSISISISTFGNNPPRINLNSAPNVPNPEGMKKRKPKDLKKSLAIFSPDKLKKFSSLPREEPKTNIRRISNKVIYEVDLPGVKSLRDISMLNLEKNMEIKAISDKKAYMKSIPNFPLIGFRLSKGKLTLELDAREN